MGYIEYENLDLEHMPLEEIVCLEKKFIVEELHKELLNNNERCDVKDGHGVLARKYWPEYFVNDKMMKGYHVHHIDFDHFNNVVSNLVVVTISEHFRLHNMFDPSFVNLRNLRSENRHKLLEDEEWKELFVQSLKDSWTDSRKESASETNKLLWEDDEYREMMIQKLKDSWTDSRKESASERAKEYYKNETEEQKKKRIENISKSRKGQSTGKRSSQTKEKMRQKRLEYWRKKKEGLI